MISGRRPAFGPATYVDEPSGFLHGRSGARAAVRSVRPPMRRTVRDASCFSTSVNGYTLGIDRPERDDFARECLPATVIRQTLHPLDAPACHQIGRRIRFHAPLAGKLNDIRRQFPGPRSVALTGSIFPSVAPLSSAPCRAIPGAGCARSARPRPFRGIRADTNSARRCIAGIPHGRRHGVSGPYPDQCCGRPREAHSAAAPVPAAT